MVRHTLCLATVAGLAFGAMAYDDGFVTCDDDSVVCRIVNRRRVYVFTSTTATATLTASRALTLDECLLVGGGGSGGGRLGGGGGGGGVRNVFPGKVLVSGMTASVTVGAGGVCESAYTCGTRGGHTTLTIGDDDPIEAWGGNGGAAFNGLSQPVFEDGKVASGGGMSAYNTTQTEGKTWNPLQGNMGGENHDVWSGGGGGAGEAGTYERGGNGLVFDLSGEARTYGSGGGGGNYRSGEGFRRGGEGAGDGAAGGGGKGGHATPGLGGGGGGGGEVTVGGTGGSGTAILAFTVGDHSSDTTRFAIGTVGDQILLGETVAPEPVVTNLAGQVLTKGEDYTLEYADCDRAGVGMVTAIGAAGTPYEGFLTSVRFQVIGVGQANEFLAVTDAAATLRILGSRVICVLTNTDIAVVHVVAKQQLTLEETLVVGAGGGGGGYLGGGGGGGAVLHTAPRTLCGPGEIASATIGAGGVGGSSYGCGLAGEKTSLTLGEGTPIDAWGGNGAGSYNGAQQPVHEDGHVASGGGLSYNTTQTEGKTWNPLYGNEGGPNNGAWPAGGGGAGEAGTYARGGNGCVLDISGEIRTYGSGGGGGNFYAGEGRRLGGEGAGAGGEGGSSLPAGNGVAGFGGGGGGGNFNGAKGGTGGSGTVILTFSIGDHTADATRLGLGPVDCQILFDEPVRPEPVVTNMAGQVLTKDVDYVLDYLDNDRAGVGMVMAIGKEGTPYEGFSESVMFQIYDEPDWEIEVTDVELGADGTAVPNVTVVNPIDGRVQTEGVDYTVTGAGLDRCGSAAVVVRGIAGTVCRNLVATRYFLVRQAGLSARVAFDGESNFIVAELPDVLFRGETVEPKPEVRNVAGDILEENVHYTLAYDGNDRVGPVTVTVTGRDPYAGTQVVTFYLSGICYVSPTGTAEADGSSWENATTFSNALQQAAANKKECEIWIAGSNVMESAAVSVALTAKTVIRGGFAGTETTPDDRAEGAVSVLDGADAYDILIFSNTAEVEIERMRFLRGLNRGLKRSASAGNLKLVDCDFSFNGAKGVCDHNTGGGGYYISNRGLGGAGASLYGSSGSKLTISRCTFTGNRQPNAGYPGSGIGAFVGGFTQATISDSLFLTNSCGGSETQASALQIYNTRARVERCEFRGNYDSGRTGKTVAVHDACGGTVFANCAFVGNAIESDSATWGDSYPGGIIVVRTTGTVPTVAFTNCTFAYNYSARDAMLCIAQGAVTVADSIFHRNLVHATAAYRAAHIVLTQPGATCTVRHSNFDSASGDYVASQYVGGSVRLEECDSGVDPAFVTGTEEFETLSGANPANLPKGPSLGVIFPSALAAFDCHLLSAEGYCDNSGALRTSPGVTSPCIDAGDPDDLRWELEPGHNGSRLNLGAYGGTAKASQTPYVEPKVNDDITCTFESEWSQPTVHFTLGGVGDYTATVVIKVSTNGTDWCYTSEPLTGKVRGDRVDYRVGQYFVPGLGQLVFRVEISSFGSEDATVSEGFDVVGKLPPWNGKGGPKNVIHVFAGAMGKGDGTSWTDAVPTLREAIALRDAEHDEIWIVGSNALSAVMGPYSITTPLKIRGGFTATENAASERPADGYSTFDGEDNVSVIVFSNAARVEFERIRFLRAANYGVNKTSSGGDLVLADCRFERCGAKSDGGKTGNGCWQAYSYGEGAATLRANGSARLWITNCVFDANRTVSGGLGGGGVGAYISGFQRATIDDTDFVGNRCNISSEAQAAALQLDSQPSTVRNCRFRGNANAAWSGKIVGVFNASGGTVFTNCLFVGNRLNSALTHNLGSSFSANYYPAPVVSVGLNSAGATCHFENCTFAYNYTHMEATLGVGVGTVTVRNSIFHRNVRNTANYMGVDGWVGSGSASLEFAWTMFDGDGDEHFGAWAENPPPVATGSCLFGYDPNFVSNTAAFDALIGTTNLSAAAFSDAVLSAVMDFNVHLRGRYADERTGATCYFSGKSPAVNAGDPDDKRWKAEPKPNGKRVNLGAYGGTPWATMSPTGSALILR